MEYQGYDMNELVKEAQHRWLKPPEVLFILQNHGNHQLTETSPQKPPSGSLFLFNKRVLRFFRKDGHIWRKKRDGKTVGEAHERLKVGNVDTLNCYYAHGEVNPNFQRRSYWMLDAAYEHIVLVHYREIIEGRHRSGLNSQGSPDLSYSASQSPCLGTARNPSSNSAVGDLCDPYQGSLSPASVEVSSELIKRNINGNNGSGDMNSFPEFEVSQALRRLEEQLSLNDDDIEALSPYYGQNNNFEVLNIERASHQDELAVLKCRGSDESFNDHTGALEDSKSNILQISGDNRNQHLQHVDLEYRIERNESPFWKETLELCSNATWMTSKEKSSFTSGANENPFYLESERLSAYLTEQPEKRSPQWMDLSGNKEENKYLFDAMSENNLSQRFSAAKQFLLGSCDHIVSPTTSLPLDVVKTEICDCSFGLSTSEVNPEYDTRWFDHVNQAKNPLGTELNSTLAEKRMFSVREISPEHGYAGESTKVIITGYFLCDPSECTWTCMFGDIEVPVQIIQEGVLRCQAPPNVPGKVTLCITSGNRQSCSEVREFEYLLKPGSCDHCNSSEKEHTKSTEELLLLVRLTQMLVSDSMPQRSGKVELGISSEDSWEHIIEDLLVGTATPFRTTDLILQELLKDKLQQWLSSKYHEGDAPSYSLSRKEQGIIHMVTGLGFEWALNLLLGSGVCINFRDINGWTALHWAARFGREKMVASLIASGASALAVTDPTSQDPTGKTAGFVAASCGHKGLAGYLSEVALTSHLSSLTLEESEISKGSAIVQAERTVESISSGSLGCTEDQLSLKDSLAAVRNAALAAARIQSAFRAHSFRRRQQNESDTACYDENDITQDDIYRLSSASKLTFRNLRDHKLNKAALSIQKKYRGWKGRKDFLAMRQKVVKIQAHVRGYQVRKKYKVIIWAVGVLDKVVLRWRRRGVGLRGYRPESECIEENEDEDITRIFRKQKVDMAIDEAVSRVLSMVESPNARQQYRRILEGYRQAKAESSRHARESEVILQVSADMEADDDELYMLGVS